MAGKKGSVTKSSDMVASRYCDDESPRGGADGKAKALGNVKTPDGRESPNVRGGSHSSADELGRRAWETTYRNRQKSRGD